MLRPSVELFRAPDGDLYLLGPDADFVIEGVDAELLTALQRLQAQPWTIADLTQHLATSDEARLRSDLLQLESEGLLARHEPSRSLLAPDDERRYDRQLAYFADALPGRERDMQAALARARVVLIGVGGLGSWTAAGLACVGVGQLVLVDDDTVELSNLNRQVLFTPDDIGAPKVRVAANWLKAFNPSIEISEIARRIESADDVTAVIAGAAVVVLTADWPPYLLDRWVNEACLAAGIPHVSAGQVPPHIRVGPFLIPQTTPCKECIERAARQRSPYYDAIAEQRGTAPSQAATIGPASAIVGGMLAMDVCHHIAGAVAPGTLARTVVLDLRTWQSTSQVHERDPQCPACGS